MSLKAYEGPLALAFTPVDSSSISKTHTVDRTDSYKLYSLSLIHTDHSTYIHTHKQINKKYVKYMLILKTRINVRGGKIS